ncbi:MAG: hypothetical protein ABI867_03000 [Kofleriaceae bacterium]
MKTLIAIALTLAALAPTASADSCVAPSANNGLPPVLANGPHHVATHTIPLAKKLVVGDLTVMLSRRFMPDFMGSKSGVWVVDLAGQDALGKKSDTTTAPGMLRVGRYRITARPAGTDFTLVIEDGVCDPEHVGKPLARGASASFWLSTEGTRLIDLRDAESWNSSDWFELRLGHGFNRNGYYNAYLGMDLVRARENKTIDFSDTVPKPFVFVDHQIEIVRVVWGPNTTVVEGEILPVETNPVAHILVRVTRLQ